MEFYLFSITKLLPLPKSVIGMQEAHRLADLDKLVTILLKFISSCEYDNLVTDLNMRFKLLKNKFKEGDGRRRSLF